MEIIFADLFLMTLGIMAASDIAERKVSDYLLAFTWLLAYLTNPTGSSYLVILFPAVWFTCLFLNRLKLTAFGFGDILILPVFFFMTMQLSVTFSFVWLYPMLFVVLIPMYEWPPDWLKEFLQINKFKTRPLFFYLMLVYLIFILSHSLMSVA
jgi:hypothetical protein